MANTKISLKGITFPDFGDDDSKKNFRLVFFIAFTDKNGAENALIVSKPAAGAWQWRKASKDFYLAPTIKGDSAILDTTILKTGGNAFPAGSDNVVEFDGKLSAITVQFIDVFDSSVGDFLKSQILPDIIERLKSLGINPVDLIPLPGIFTAIIKDKIKVVDIATEFAEKLKDGKKDKLLHSVSRKYKNQKTLTLKSSKVWDDKKQKSGTFGVQLAIT